MDSVPCFNMDIQNVVGIMSFDDWVMEYYEEIWENQEIELEDIC